MDGFAPCFQVELALDHGEIGRGGDDAGACDPPVACVGLAREPVPRQPGQDAGAEQRRRGAEQVQHLRQPSPDPRLRRGDPHHRSDVTAGQSRDRPRRGPSVVRKRQGPRPAGVLARRRRSPGPSDAGRHDLDPDRGATTPPATSGAVLRLPRRQRWSSPCHVVDWAERGRRRRPRPRPRRGTARGAACSAAGGSPPQRWHGDRGQRLGPRGWPRRAPGSAGPGRRRGSRPRRWAGSRRRRRPARRASAPPRPARRGPRAGRPAGPAGCTGPSSRTAESPRAGGTTGEA